MTEDNWLSKNFDNRQQMEIRFSQMYANGYNHGTDGHNAKLIIAKMAELLDRISNILTPVGSEEDYRAKLSRIEKVLLDQ